MLVISGMLICEWHIYLFPQAHVCSWWHQLCLRAPRSEALSNPRSICQWSSSKCQHVHWVVIEFPSSACAECVIQHPGHILSLFPESPVPQVLNLASSQDSQWSINYQLVFQHSVPFLAAKCGNVENSSNDEISALWNFHWVQKHPGCCRKVCCESAKLSVCLTNDTSGSVSNRN